MYYGDNDFLSRLPNGTLKPLADGQFDISGLTFGGPFDTIVLDGFDPGDADWENQDSDNPFGNNTLFGRDYLRAPTWSFEAFTNGYTADESLDAISEMAARWRAEELKEQNGALQVLRYRIGTQTRRVYGRGRKFWHGVDGRTYAGTSPVSFTFQLAYPASFEDEQSELNLSIVPSTGGGFTTPFTAPLTVTGEGAPYQGYVEDVGGGIPTPLHIYIHGPIINPYVAGDGWKVSLNLELKEDQEVHISSAAGNIAIEDNFGRNMAGKLTPSTRLRDVRLKPGPSSATFGGIDPTGTARARLIWRPAYPTL